MSENVMLEFLLCDTSSVAGQDWQLDDETGAPYTPLRFIPSVEQIQQWQVELASAIAMLAALEAWTPDSRADVLNRVLSEPGVTLPYSIRTVRELLKQHELS